MSMIRKSSRGIAAFLTNIPDDKLPMRFDENNQPLHHDPKILAKFSSYYGMTVQHCFPIHIQMCDFEDKDFDYVWSETKQFWKIETDVPKEYMKKWAVRLGTNFRSRTACKFIHNPDPDPEAPKAYEKYPFIDKEDWELFVKERTSKEAKEKREKAQASNAMNKNKPKVGRQGYRGLKRKQGTIWPQLEESYPELKGIQNSRSRLFILGHAIKNKKTKLYALDEDGIEKANALCRVEKVMIADGSYYENKEDPLVRVVGPEHGGRSRTVSDIIGYTKVHGGLFKNFNYDRNSVQQVNMCSDGPVNYPPIMIETRCELLLKVGDSLVKVAEGMAWPSAGAVLHFKPIMVDCVKVSVDNIVESYKDLNVYNVTTTSEIDKVGKLVCQIVQWPREAIKLLNQRAPSKPPSALRVDSSCSSQSHTSASPQIHENDTMNTSYLCSQKVNEVSHASPQFHDENITSTFYQLVDEEVDEEVDEDNYQLEVSKANLFQDGFLNALLSMEQQQTGTDAPISGTETLLEIESV